jgi:WD40 repeat protein
MLVAWNSFMFEPALNIKDFQLDGYVEAAGELNNTLYFVTVDSVFRFHDFKQECLLSGIDCIAAAFASENGFLIFSDGSGSVHKMFPDGTQETLFQHAGSWIDNLAIHPDGSIAMSYGRHITILGHDKEYHFELEHAAHGLAWAPKGRRLAVASYNTVYLYWIRSETKPVMLEWKGAHLDVLFSPDNRYLISTMQENALHGWVLSNNTHMRMSGYSGKVQSWDWSVKGRWLATAGAQCAVLWPFQKKAGPQGQQPLQLGCRDVKVCSVAFHPKDNVLACGYEDGLVLAIRIDDGSEALIWRGKEAQISALYWSHAGQYLSIGDTNGCIAIAAF